MNELILSENKKLYGEIETEIKNEEYRSNFIISTKSDFPDILVNSPVGKPDILVNSPAGKPDILVNSPAGKPDILVNSPAGKPDILINSKLKTITFIVNSDTTTTIEYFNDDYNVVALNFANCYSVCGGIENGANAQEEDICRSSPMLYNSLQFLSKNHKKINGRYFYYDWGKWYKQLIFTPNVIFRRNSKYAFYKTPTTSSIITSAAPNLSNYFFDGDDFQNIKQGNDDIINKKYIQEKLINMIKYIYYSPFLAKSYNKKSNIVKKNPDENKKDNVINTNNMILLLGPWGCGAFVPHYGAEIYRKFMAEQFATVLKNVDSRYKKVCFTFLKNDQNFEIYRQVFSKYFKLEIFDMKNNVD